VTSFLIDFISPGTPEQQEEVWGSGGECYVHLLRSGLNFIQVLKVTSFNITSFNIKVHLNLCKMASLVAVLDRCQFHQHFYVQIFRTNAVLAAFFYVRTYVKKLPKWCSYKKRARLMLMKLTGFKVAVLQSY